MGINRDCIHYEDAPIGPWCNWSNLPLGEDCPTICKYYDNGIDKPLQNQQRFKGKVGKFTGELWIGENHINTIIREIESKLGKKIQIIIKEVE